MLLIGVNGTLQGNEGPRIYMIACVTTQVISEINIKSNTSGCQGREAAFLEQENVRYFIQTVNNSQGSLLDNF